MKSPPVDCIFCWHAVVPAPDEAFFAFTTSTTDFCRQIDSIASYYEIVPLRHLLAGRSVASPDASARPPRAALTFDDALDCQAEHALPVLESRRLPYTLCIPVASVSSARPLWNTLLRLCILRTSARSLDLGWMSLDLSSPVIDRYAVADEVQDLLLGMKEPEWRATTDTLFQQFADVIDKSMANANIRPMSWAQIEALSPELCEAASHSMLHRPAVYGDQYEDLLDDARRSRAEIERRLRRPCVVYCFPFGIFTAASVVAAHEAGYATLLTSCRVPVGVMSDNLEGRLVAGDVL